MTSARRDYRLGLLLVMAAAVAWSTSGLFTRALALDTPTILFWRGLFGAIGTAIVIALIPGTGGLRSFGRLGWPGLAYAGVTALSMLFFISALLHTSVAHVAIITAIVPFVAAYLGWAILREQPTRAAIAASGVALAGVAIMAGIGRDGQASGDALAVLMAICMAGMILIARRYDTIPALAATCVASGLSAVAMLPFASLGAVSAHDLGILALFGLVNQVLGFGLFALGARLLPPMETALIMALDAPLAPLWVWLVFAETPGVATILGGCVVFVAVTGHILWGHRRPERICAPGKTKLTPQSRRSR
jgi:drug/metabolite transporter (DMT)-like permease